MVERRFRDDSIENLLRIRVRFALVLLFSLLLVSGSTLAQNQAKQIGESGRASSGYIFVSPNTLTGLSFQQATRNLHSRNELRLMRAARKVLCSIHASAHLTPVIGSWSDGTENTVLIRAPLDTDSIRYVSAKLAELAHQKAVLYFRTQDNGSAVIYLLRFSMQGGTLEQIAGLLDKSGI